MNVTAHIIVKNEDRWVWFAIQSVLPYVKCALIYDTGSTDKTVEIVKSIKSPKIIFEEKGEVDKIGFSKLRQEQLNKTETEWFLVVDGDEIWPEKQLEKLIESAKNSPEETLGVVCKTRNCIGDVFHYLPESAGNYKIGKWKGNLTLHLLKKTNSLRVIGDYGCEEYANSNGPVVKQPAKLVFCDCWYLHTTFLKRNSSDNTKTSGGLGRQKTPEKGIYMAKPQLPEIFNKSRPDIVPSPFIKRGLKYEIISSVTTPLLDIKRHL